MSIALGDEIETRSEMEAVCGLFSPDRCSEAFEYLSKRSETPLQVPFYYLKLVHMGKAPDGASRPAKLAAEEVELAYRAILQRLPEDVEVVRFHAEKCADPAELVAALLSSQEAVLRMPQLFARAFPWARLMWHVHIPKTAGTSFYSAAQDSGWGYVNTNLLSGAAGDLRRVASAVRLCAGPHGRAIITGHWHLLQHLDCIGPFDQVVSFVRNPLESCISEFNFAVDVVHRQPNVHAAEAGPFLARGLDPNSFLETYKRGFFVANLQCSYVSSDATCAAAIKNLATCNAELLPSCAVNSAITRYFPKVARKNANVSNKHVTSADLHPQLREEILVMHAHDCVLNQIAEMRFRESQH